MHFVNTLNICITIQTFQTALLSEKIVGLKGNSRKHELLKNDLFQLL